MHNQEELKKEWDFNQVTVTTEINRTVEEAWPVVGDFSTAGQFLNASGEILSGDGSAGTIRSIADVVLEVLVGSGLWSYTYAQIVGPMAAYNYHGSIAVHPSGENRCKVVYTLTYNQASFDPEKRVSEHQRLTGRFQGMVDAMKQKAEESK